MEPELQAEIRRRGISRLCHFTPITNLPSIFGRGGVHSVLQARELGIPLRLMDGERSDGRLGHVSLSIQFPNAFLMRNYGHVRIPDHPKERWIPTAVLDIGPTSVDWTHALFSPVNASTASGAHQGSSTAQFRELFAREVPNRKSPTRSQRHPPSCPTDLQAEVMVAGGVPVQAIRRVFVERERDEREVRAMRPPVSVVRWPEIFRPESLSAAIRRGELLTPP